MVRSRRILLVLALSSEVLSGAVLLHVHALPYPMLWWYAIASPLFVGAVLLLRSGALTGRAAVLLVLGVGAVLQIVALTASPQTSDDSSRYVWDATVQLHGTDPYRYPPSAPQLAPLRTPELFGPPSSSCVHPLPHGCTAINRPTSRTIYPPVAEAAFTATRIAFGGKGFLFPYQLVAAFGALAVALLLLRLGRPPWQVATWAWCPVVVVELGNNAHIDWLAALFAVLALGSATKGRDLRAAAWLGLAIATKLYPALLLPALMKRRPVAAVVTSAAVVVLSYVPHLFAVGGDIVGYLPGYLHEEGYESGDRFELLARVLPHPVDAIVGVLILLAVAVWAWRRIQRVDDAALAVLVAAFLVTTPTYGWYAALLVAVIAMTGRWQWLPLAIAPSIGYLLHTEITKLTGWPALCYLVGGVASVALWATTGRSREPLHPAAAERILTTWTWNHRRRCESSISTH